MEKKLAMRVGGVFACLAAAALMTPSGLAFATTVSQAGVNDAGTAPDTTASDKCYRMNAGGFVFISMFEQVGYRKKKTIDAYMIVFFTFI